MTEALIRLARRIERQPWNEPGTDKTWVLRAMWQHRLFARGIANAERVPPQDEED